MEVKQRMIVARKCSSLACVSEAFCRRQRHYHSPGPATCRWMLLCLAMFCHTVPGSTETDIRVSLEMTPVEVWRGGPSLMRCIATPKYTGISKVLWTRKESDGTRRNVYFYNRDYPSASGPYESFLGRVTGWLEASEPGVHYLRMNRTLVSDSAEYYCTITDDNQADHVSPTKQLTVNVKHFDHNINVNESFESFSRCEEVILNSGGDTEVVTLTCSVSSWPKSRLSWSASPSDRPDQLLSSTKQNCTIDGDDDMYTCTSTATLVLHGLVSRTTNVSCRAHYDALTHTSDACVTVIYDNFSPPQAITSGSVQYTVLIVVMSVVSAIIAIVVAILVLRYIKNRHGRRGNRPRPTSHTPSFMSVPADEV